MMPKRTLTEAKKELAATINEKLKEGRRKFTVPWPQPNTYRVTREERLAMQKR